MTFCYTILPPVNEPFFNMNHMIVKVKVNVGVEVMKPVLSKNNVEVRKLVNNQKAPCEIVFSMFITAGSDCFSVSIGVSV